MVWPVCERRSDLWARPSSRNLRQTKSLTSSAAGECLCCRFSLTPGLTKQAKLPLLLAVEFKSDGVEPLNITEAERPKCLFPASMLAVFICCSCPYNLRISSWKSKHDEPRISSKKLTFEEWSPLILQRATHIKHPCGSVDLKWKLLQMSRRFMRYCFILYNAVVINAIVWPFNWK